MKDDKHLKWVFTQALKAIAAYNHCTPLPPGELVQKAINTNDEKLAKQICLEYSICNDFLEN